MRISDWSSDVCSSDLYTAGDVARSDGLTMVLRPGDGVRAALERLRRNDHDFGYVHDKGKRFRGVVSVQSLKLALERGDDRFEGAFLPEIDPLTADTVLTEALGQIGRANV